MFPGDKLNQRLERRKNEGALRSLKIVPENFIDFSSNDYLGFSRKGFLREQVSSLQQQQSFSGYGAAGSRLLSGNNSFTEELEKELASFYRAESALLFNSGYDANLGFFSSIPQKDDFVFYDELVHASIHDGLRLSPAKSYKFLHNDLADLDQKIKRQETNGKSVFISVESVYSMDGDFAPLEKLAEYCEANDFALVVDEAHSTGVYGSGGEGLCVEKGIEKKCFARLYTFGKALGAHGALVAGNSVLRDYLVNFCRPFIFSTALPYDSVQAIKAAHAVPFANEERKKLVKLISVFRERFREFKGLAKSNSAIQALVVGGNGRVQEISDELFRVGFDVRAIKSPTVKEGTERLRLSLHSFNSEEEINRLFLELSRLTNL
jgi:8-amino-7-oxononanoate synthase